MNRVSRIVFKISSGLLLLLNIVAVAIVIFNFDLKLASSLAWFNSETVAIALLAYLELAAIIISVSICAAFCILSGKKWLVVIGTITSLLVCGYAGYLALLFSFGFAYLSICFIALSSCALLLVFFAKRRLASFNNQTSIHTLFRPALILTIAILLLSGFWLLPDEAKANMLLRHVRRLGLNPLDCTFELIAVGPLFPEQATLERHRQFRDRIAPLERALAEYLRSTGREVVGSHAAKGEPDPKLVAEITRAFNIALG